LPAATIGAAAHADPASSQLDMQNAMVAILACKRLFPVGESSMGEKSLSRALKRMRAAVASDSPALS